jgi:hypothetical protein
MRLRSASAGLLVIAAQAWANPLPKRPLASAAGRPIERALHYFTRLADRHVLGEPEYQKIITDWREHKKIGNPISEARASERQVYQFHRDGIDNHLRDPAVQAEGARLVELAEQRLAQLQRDTAEHTAALEATSLPYPELDFIAVAPGPVRFAAEYDHHVTAPEQNDFWNREVESADREIEQPFALQKGLVTNALYRSVMALEKPEDSQLLRTSQRNQDPDWRSRKGALPPLDDHEFWSAPLRVHVFDDESRSELEQFLRKLNAIDPVFGYRLAKPEERQRAFGTQELSLPMGDTEIVHVSEIHDPELAAPFAYNLPALYYATRLDGDAGERYRHRALDGQVAAGIRLLREPKPGAAPRPRAGQGSP